MTEQTAITKHEHQVSIIRTMDDAERAAKSMVASGFFADSKQAAQAVVKILAGQELGFGPFASMTGVNIIQNKPVLAANLMAAAVKKQEKYNYRIVTANDKICELTWLERGQEVGKSSFTWDEAVRAGLSNKDNWKKYPSDMLFARALSRGQKRYAPDVFNGATVYTPDEIGASVDEEGNAIIDVKAVDAPSEDSNPDPIDEKAWTMWLTLCNRAEKVDVKYPAGYQRDTHTKTELRTLYAEILGYVEAAEAQAKATP